MNRRLDSVRRWRYTVLAGVLAVGLQAVSAAGEQADVPGTPVDWQERAVMLEQMLRGLEERSDRIENELQQTRTLLREETLIRTQTAMREQFDGDAGPSLAWSLNDAGLLMAGEGRLELAQILFERALKTLDAQLPPEHPARGTVLQHLGDVLLRRQDPAAAERYQDAAVVFGAAAGANHPRLAAVLNAWATSLGSQGRTEEAETLYRRAIRIYEGQLPRDPLDLAAPLHNLALLLLGTNRVSEAGPLLEQALRVLKRNREAKTGRAVPVLRALARYEAATGNSGKAQRYAQQADTLTAAQLQPPQKEGR